MPTKLSLQFKEKHICYCADFMFGIVMNDFFYVAKAVSNTMETSTLAPDDLVTVNILGDDLLKLYTYLGTQQEAQCNVINTEMKDVLLPQLITLLSDTDAGIAAEAQRVLTIIQEKTAAGHAAIDQKIVAGRQKLKPTIPTP